MRRFPELKAIVMLFVVTSLIIEHARAGSEVSEQNDSLRLRDLGTQRLTVGQISPVAPPEQTATPTPTVTPSASARADIAIIAIQSRSRFGQRRDSGRAADFVSTGSSGTAGYGEEPLPRSLELPRKGVRESVPQRHKLDYETYPDIRRRRRCAAEVRSRCRIAGSLVSVAGNVTPIPQRRRRINQAPCKLWHPYLQSKLKGDAPIIGQDIFLNLTLSDFFQFEARQTANPERSERAQPEQLGVFRPERTILFLERFFTWHRSFQRRDRL